MSGSQLSKTPLANKSSNKVNAIGKDGEQILCAACQSPLFKRDEVILHQSLSENIPQNGKAQFNSLGIQKINLQQDMK